MKRRAFITLLGGATALGITLPVAFTARADEVLE